MAEESKPNGNEETGGQRLDRIERALNLMLEDHIQFREEHKLLLSAQVQMHGGMEELRGGLNELRGGLNELRGGLNELRGGLNELRGGLNELRGGLNDLRVEVTTLTRQVGTLTGTVGTLANEFRGFVHHVDVMRTEFDRRLKRLES